MPKKAAAADGWSFGTLEWSSEPLHETVIFWYLCKVLVGPGTPYLGARHHESDPPRRPVVPGCPNGHRI